MPARPVWAPKVSREKLRLLYESEAEGRLDTGLLDDVYVTLYLRCQSILQVTEAAEGHVTCPECGERFERTERKYGKQRRDELLTCPGCGWQTDWETFHRSYEGKQLVGANALPAVAVFVEGFEKVRKPEQRLLAIDRLVHAFHNQLREQPNRPLAVNLIEGSLQQVVALILGLAYGGTTATERGEDDWRERLSASCVARHVEELNDKEESGAQPRKE